MDIFDAHMYDPFPIMDIGQHSHFMHGRHIIRSNCVTCKSLTSMVKPYLHACKPQCVPHLLYCLSCRHVVKISRMSTLSHHFGGLKLLLFLSLSCPLCVCVCMGLCVQVCSACLFTEKVWALWLCSVGPFVFKFPCQGFCKASSLCCLGWVSCFHWIINGILILYARLYSQAHVCLWLY